jgi:hypothetical protein
MQDAASTARRGLLFLFQRAVASIRDGAGATDPMPSNKAGQEIDAFCTRCKLDLLHRIVAVVDGRPIKVECRTCMTTHVYRAPRAAGAAMPAAGRSAAAPRRRVRADEHPLVPPEHARVQLYRMTERFAPETWLQHKSFGIGQVVRDLGSNKIEVRFEQGLKVLVHGGAS